MKRGYDLWSRIWLAERGERGGKKVAGVDGRKEVQKGEQKLGQMRHGKVFKTAVD